MVGVARPGCVSPVLVLLQRLCCLGGPQARPPVQPPPTGRIMVVRGFDGIDWKNVFLLTDSRVASCVSGAVYIPTPEHAGTFE